MQYATLASGSSGNCHALSDGKQIILIDVGISLKQIKSRLTKIGWEPLQVKLVVLSHEHTDHISAVPVLLRNTNWIFMVNKETLEAISSIYNIEIPSNRVIILNAGHMTNWHGIHILPFAVPHDAVNPVAFRVEMSGSSAAIVTDLGHQTAIVKEHCLDLDLLVLEANHDVQMLRYGNYPSRLKARILSKIGHLSNESMSTLLINTLSDRLKNVVLAHLSKANNDPILAKLAAAEALKSTSATLHIAQQNEPLLIKHY
jgi:phosphoribosyl 1,2-cyclic phosphodiesterase